VSEKKTKKPEVIRSTVPPEKRAKGTKLPLGNPTIVARDFNAAKLPENLKAIYDKVAKLGKEGVRLSTLCPKSSTGKYARWLIRQLVKMEAVKAIAETEPAKAAAKST